MEKQEKFYRSVISVAVVTVGLLLIPFLAMQFTGEVDWGVFDFILMGALIFSTGISYKLVTRNAPNLVYRLAFGLGLGAMLFMIWANLGVGLIGSGPNAGNLLYIGVLLAGIIGMLRSDFSAGGMERAMYITVLALIVHTVIAFIAGMQNYPGSSAKEILAVNGFFAVLFTISALLFSYASREPVQQ
jgi:heme/copper-type cytochrome/quinol oxidase subunit 4